MYDYWYYVLLRRAFIAVVAVSIFYFTTIFVGALPAIRAINEAVHQHEIELQEAGDALKSELERESIETLNAAENETP